MLIETLQRRSRIKRSKLDRIAFTASLRYKTYEIDKRNGQKRTIHQPSRQLKSVQRWINTYLFKRLPKHTNATAYHKGASIAHNARLHAFSNYTLRIDFEDFFPSFSFSDIYKFLADSEATYNFGLTPNDIEFVCAITTRKNKLTIGAPSSPILTNTLMYEFDSFINEFSLSKNAVYTRYADDIFISSKEKFDANEFEKLIRTTAENYKYGALRINDSKTLLLSKKYTRTITGLIITPDHKVSVGRKRKRKIKSLLQKFRDNHLEGEEILSLQGHISFVRDVEPSFYQSLKAKYGDELLDSLASYGHK